MQPAGVQLTVVSSPGLGFNFSDDENFYFSLYCNKVALNLSPCHGSNNNFWSRFPLRDSMTRKSIRHSILSIGAYARALIDLKAEQPLLHTTDRPWWPTAVFNHHREAALTHHAQALACLRQEIGATGVDNRATMAATLLFIVFENMMGNYHSSGILVRRGIKVLNDMGRTQSRQFIWNTHCGAFEPPNEMDEMAHIFLRHSITSVLLPFPHGKSAFHMLFDDDDDDDDEVTANDTSEDMSLIFTTQSNVPRTFEHARTVWETLLPAIGRFYAKAAWRNLNPQYEIDDDAFIDQSLLLSRLQSFGAGLATLVLAETDCTVLHRLEFFEAHHAVAEILVSCCLDRTEMSYDDYTQEFVLALAKANAWLEGARRSTAFPSDTDFTNEVGMLPLLAFVASKCRVYAVRLDALNVLRKSRTREGPWDGISLGNAVRSLMQLEGHDDEGGVMNVFAPLSQVRYVWTNMFWDFEHRQMTMEYTKAWSDSQGDLDKVIRVVSG